MTVSSSLPIFQVKIGAGKSFQRREEKSNLLKLKTLTAHTLDIALAPRVMKWRPVRTITPSLPSGLL